MLGKNGFPSSAIPVSVTMKQAASVRVFTILPISALKKQLERDELGLFMVVGDKTEDLQKDNIHTTVALEIQMKRIFVCLLSVLRS